MTTTLSPWSKLRTGLHPRAKALSIVTCSLILLGISILQSPVTSNNFTYKNVDFDMSWLISLGALLGQGQVSGRDFQFNYGPLAQFFSWIWVGVGGSNTPTYNIPLIFLTYTILSIVLLGILFGLMRQMTWRSTLFAYCVICVLGIPFIYAASRPILSLVCASVLSHAMAASSSNRRITLSLLTGGLCVVGQLLTSELALYSQVGCIVVLLFYSLAAKFPKVLNRHDLWHPRIYLTILGIVIGVFLVSNFLISVMYKLSSTQYIGLFDYQRYAVEIMRGYNNTEGLGWDLASVPSIVLILLVLYVAGFIVTNLRTLDTATGYSIVALTVFGTIQLKMAMVRSDTGHIVVAFIPLIIVFLSLSRGWLKRGNVSVVWSVLLLALLITWPLTSFSAFKQVQGWLQGTRSLRMQLQLLAPQPADPAAFLPLGLAEDAADLSAPILNFPYENYMGLTLGRRLVAPVLTILDTHTSILQQMYIDKIKEQGEALEVIYGLDNVVSFEVDGVQHITRAPLIFEYLLHNFELKSDRAYGDGYYLLKHRKEPINVQITNLPFQVHRDTSSLTLVLDQPATCSLARIGVTISYPFTSLVGRANTLKVRFLSGQTIVRDTGMVAIENGVPFTTYVNLLGDREFYSVFGTTNIGSRTWDSLRITVNQTDILGVSPDHLEVNKLECVNP